MMFTINHKPFVTFCITIAAALPAPELFGPNGDFASTCTWAVDANYTISASCSYSGRPGQRPTTLDLNQCLGYAGNNQLVWKEYGEFWYDIKGDPNSKGGNRCGCRRSWNPHHEQDLVCWIGDALANTFTINLNDHIANFNGTLWCFAQQGTIA
ncbi:hypothetical protein TruAng_004941 [Truncatella angustata]|nr:hypothetical protein TruAng_004941 [Truncatella angustata]